jgi:hypothetical protein
MDTINNTQIENLYLEFYASYWNITAEQFECIIIKIGSDDFLKIHHYVESKLTRNNTKLA